jgi:hypothetical protein
MSEEINPDDGIQLLRTIAAHRDYVRRGMQLLTHALERRALAHDLSKLSPDEFAGFSRINKAAREHPYGSPEYRAGLKAEKPTIALHYSRNSHHPEFWATDQFQADAAGMGFLDLIEMVIDWRSAYLTYGSQGTWDENMARQIERYREQFSSAQWWLVNQVSAWLIAEEGRS